MRAQLRHLMPTGAGTMRVGQIGSPQLAHETSVSTSGGSRSGERAPARRLPYDRWASRGLRQHEPAGARAVEARKSERRERSIDRAPDDHGGATRTPSPSGENAMKSPSQSSTPISSIARPPSRSPCGMPRRPASSPCGRRRPPGVPAPAATAASTQRREHEWQHQQRGEGERRDDDGDGERRERRCQRDRGEPPAHAPTRVGRDQADEQHVGERREVGEHRGEEREARVLRAGDGDRKARDGAEERRADPVGDESPAVASEGRRDQVGVVASRADGSTVGCVSDGVATARQGTCRRRAGRRSGEPCARAPPAGRGASTRRAAT